MAQLVASMSGVGLGGIVMVLGSNLARGKIFTASIGSVDSLYPSVYIYIYIYIYILNKINFVCCQTSPIMLCPWGQKWPVQYVTCLGLYRENIKKSSCPKPLCLEH